MLTAPVRIALVEDHPGMRSELTQLFAKYHARIELVKAFGDAESFLSVARRLQIDVATIDLGLPGMSGVDAIHSLADAAPNVKAVALTVFDDERNVIEALGAGAYGYVLKNEPGERIVKAIEEAARGENPVSARVAGFLIARARVDESVVDLSDREAELAVALADGLSYAECAERMDIALATVQEYVKRLYRKLDVRSRAEVKRWIERTGRLR